MSLHRPSRDPDRPTGQVVEILERKPLILVGSFESAATLFHLAPDDPVYPDRIPLRIGKDADRLPRHGDKIVAEIRGSRDLDSAPRARLVEVLGARHEPGVDMLCILKRYRLAEEFPSEVAEEVRALGGGIEPEDLEGRRDCRKDLVATIDPEDAKDFDDAFHLHRTREGKWVLQIHIADVSHYVRPGSRLDREALRRGNSTYLVDRVVPMLPEQISNDLCSLRPRADRLTKCAAFVLDPEGGVVSTQFFSAVIHSRRRFTYQEALSVLQRKADDPVERMLVQAGELAQKLRARRFREGSLDLDFPENRIHLDQEGKVSRVERMENDASHQLIEEFMLLANQAVARRLRTRRKPAIYRIHDNPDDAKLLEFGRLAKSHGIECGNLREKRHIQKILEQLAQADSLGEFLKVEFLRSLKRACYADHPKGHYGLAMRDYTHFTSPIRRYADLVVHRCLFGPHPGIDMAQVAGHVSRTERNSADAERESCEVKLFAWLEEGLRTSRPFRGEARVVDVRPFGVFVEVDSIGLKGLVARSETMGQHYSFTGMEYVPSRGGEAIRPGSEIPVTLTQVDHQLKRLRFEISDLEPKPGAARRKKRYRLPRRKRFR